VKIPFGTQAYKHKSLTLSAQRCINLYAEQQPQDAKEAVALLWAPGLPLYQAVGAGPIRGLMFMRNFLYVVSGTRLIRVANSGATLDLGEIPGVGLVQMANDGTNIVILSGPESDQAYVATQSTLTQITDSDFPGASDVAWMDGYFVFIKPDSNQFFLSELNDPTDYDATQIATAEGSPEDLIGLIVDHRELWLMKEGPGTEVWYNSGASPFPFERATGAYLERGCASKKAITKLDNSVFWVGDDGVVYRAEGYSPRRVSTHAIEQQISKNGTADIVAFSYTDEGHPFYVLKKPGVFTFVYDVATELWHERVSYQRDDYRVSTYCFAFDKHIVGDDANNKLYVLDPDDVTGEDGDTVIATVTGSPLWAEGNRFTLKSLLIDFEHGAGLTTGQGSDPQVMLRFSRDGGHSWGPEKWRDLGKKGKYNTRCLWRRFGTMRQGLPEISISDPIPRVVIGAYADVVQGSL
jgi:hypothetical protein